MEGETIEHMQKMKYRGKRHGSRLYIIVWIVLLMILGLMAWRMAGARDYVYTAAIQVLPAEESFELRIFYEGDYAAVKKLRGSARYDTQRISYEREHGLVIQGTSETAASGEPFVLEISYESDEDDQGAPRIYGRRSDQIQCEIQKEENWKSREYALAIMTSMIAAGGYLFFIRRNREKQMALEAIDALTAASDAWREQAEAFGFSVDEAKDEGLRWFLAEDRCNAINQIQEILLAGGLLFLIIERPYGNGLGTVIANALLSGILLSLFSFSANVYRNKKFLEILMTDVRPWSAAWACLLEAARTQTALSRRIRLYNSAVCLYRAGLWNEALALGTKLPGMGGQPGTKILILESRLREKCYRALGQEREAGVEWEIQASLLKEKNGLGKQADEIRVNREMYEAKALGEWERMEACAKLDLEKCRSDYERLPVFWELAQLYEQTGRRSDAMELYQKILTFSPENWETREAMAYGPCTYHRPGRLWKESIGMKAVRIGGLVLFTSGLVMMAGINWHERGYGTYAQDESTAHLLEMLEGKVPETEINKSEVLENGDMEKAEEPETQADDLESRHSFSVTLPENWDEKVIRREAAGGAVLFCQKSSYEKMGDGLLFSIRTYEDGSYRNLPDYRILGYDGASVYIASRPTDVAFYAEDEEVWREYEQLQSQIDEILESFQILSDTASYDGEEFLFPNSSACFLQEEDLLNLTAQKLRIAKNEIYARHGRRFADRNLQSYFEQCSWYEGVVAPEEFLEEWLNEYEKENVKRIDARQEELRIVY